MPCYFPKTAYRSQTEKTANGKAVIVFDINKAKGHPHDLIKLACNQCIGCRIERTKQWAVRCMHEASLYENNCFITLTFAPKCLHPDGLLVRSDFQNFMKRLRKEHQGLQCLECKGITQACLTCQKPSPIRFFHCGEYGDQLKRPHHHACLFNFDFQDKQVWSIKKGITLYRSAMLEELWQFGFSTIGEVTYESAAYVARYIQKKWNGKNAVGHYTRLNTKTGKEYQLPPEYCTMSLRPGIASGWFKKFSSDVYPKDYLTLKGRKFRSPKYYDNIYDKCEPEEFAKIQQKRKLAVRRNRDNNTPDRLLARRAIAERKEQITQRELENDT